MRNSKKIQYILSLLTYIGLIVIMVLRSPDSVSKHDVYASYFTYILNGFLWTILISLCVFVLSFIFGGIMFLGSISKVSYFRYLVKHWTYFMFGSPLLVIVIIFYFFVGPNLLAMNSKLFLGLLALTLYFAPFMMKVYEGAYNSIDKKQFLVCDMFGFTKFQMYYYIIFPQMIRIMLPPLSGNLANVIKSSSLLYLIGFQELYYTLTNVQSKSFAYTQGYILMIVLYLIITIPLIKLSELLEKRIKL